MADRNLIPQCVPPSEVETPRPLLSAPEEMIVNAYRHYDGVLIKYTYPLGHTTSLSSYLTRNDI